ncbi:MAG: hypothetical protein QM734_13755 [Cyclobacteriaceae bacterium]
MIVSKPLKSTIFSFVLFLVISIVVITMNAIIIFRAPEPAWYNYVVVGVLIPIALFVFYKIFLRYKILSFGNNQILIEYPVMRQLKKYPLDQVNKWTENVIKTGKNSTYKEVRILFTDGQKLSIGHREHTDYSKIVQYLLQKVAKKKVTVS